MRSEMAYKFKGAGHDEPEGKRKYDKPDNKLAEALEEWLQMCFLKEFCLPDKRYDTYYGAVRCLKNLKPTIAEIHSTMLHCKGKLSEGGIAMDKVNVGN